MSTYKIYVYTCYTAECILYGVDIDSGDPPVLMLSMPKEINRIKDATDATETPSKDIDNPTRPLSEMAQNLVSVNNPDCEKCGQPLQERIEYKSGDDLSLL